MLAKKADIYSVTSESIVIEKEKFLIIWWKRGSCAHPYEWKDWSFYFNMC